jgi:hypothetical protein
MQGKLQKYLGGISGKNRFELIQNSGYDEVCYWLVLGGQKNPGNAPNRIEFLRKEFIGKGMETTVIAEVKRMIK